MNSLQSFSEIIDSFTRKKYVVTVIEYHLYVMYIARKDKTDISGGLK